MQDNVKRDFSTRGPTTYPRGLRGPTQRTARTAASLATKDAVRTQRDPPASKIASLDHADWKKYGNKRQATGRK